MGRFRNPESFDVLSDLLEVEQDHYVRMEIILSIGRIGSERAVGFLRRWVDDQELGSEAVKGLADARSEPATLILLELLAIAHQHSPVAAHLLSQRQERRAIPLLVKLQTATEFQLHQFRPYWGGVIAEFGTVEAFEALKDLVSNSDKQIRSGAIEGLSTLAFNGGKERSIKSAARKLLEKAKEVEVDAELGSRIQTLLEIIPVGGGRVEMKTEPSPFS
jgi:HEAT repeat protein